MRHQKAEFSPELRVPSEKSIERALLLNRRKTRKEHNIELILISSHNHGHPFDFLGHPLVQDARLLTLSLRNKTNTKKTW